MRNMGWSSLFVLCLSLAALESSAIAQVSDAPNDEGRTALQNARGGSRRARVPGRMVRDGIIRTEQVGDIRIGVDVDETEEPRVETGLLVSLIDSLFEQLSTAIQLFDTLLRARAGLPPRGTTLPASLATHGDTTLTEDNSDMADGDADTGLDLNSLVSGRGER